MSFKRETPWDIKLHRAAIRGDCDVIINLLNSGRVHVDCRYNDGTTPLMFAVAACNFTCVQELLEQGGDPNARRFETGATPLFFAAQNVDIATMRLLLKYGAFLDQSNFDGGTPLLVAWQEGHKLVVRELLLLGADPNQAMRDRANHFLSLVQIVNYYQAQNGHCIIARLLLEKGAIVDPRRTDGATPLWIAAQMGWSDVCSVLLEKGAFIDALRNDGASPLFKAAHKGFRDIVRILLLHKPKLGLLLNGETVLHGAAMFGHLDIIKILIRYGSDVNVTNREGNTPYQLAVKYKHQPTIDYLRSLQLQRVKQ